MDLPPSGWYPDPYRTPQLLRWWDGSVWTQHTHPDESAAGAGTGAEQVTGVQATAVASTAVQAAVLTATAGQASIGQATTGQAGSEQPSTDRLRRTRPPTGQRTQPQPALPEDYQAAVAAVQAAALQATSVQPFTGQPFTGQPFTGQPLTGQPLTGQPAAAQPTTAAPASLPPAALQPTTVQPLTVQPGYPQPAVMPAMSGADGSGTQVLYYGGGPWAAPGPGVPGPGLPGGPGMPGGPGGPANLYGYQEAQRRRRRRVLGGVGAGTAVAVVAIVVIAMNLGGSPAPAADQTKVTPTAAAATTPASASPSPSPSASASASPTATAAGSTLSDGQSGLTYAQLAAPWQAAGCPSNLNNGAITWTDGEYAAAGTVNGATTWYGEACSGPLPASYGYTGTTDLQTVAENLAQTFDNAYYAALSHTTSVESDQATSVGGHSAWAVTWDIAYTNAAAQGASWTDEQAEAVVVDNGTSQPAVFFTSVPQNLNEGNVSGLISSLQLSAGGPGAAAASSPGGPGGASP